MNLFVPSPEIRPSVEALDDKRVVKMVLETAQLLSTAIRILNPETTLPVYKMTHKNHPVSIWVRSSIDNYKYGMEYFVTICNEYTHRFGKTHKSMELLPHFCEFFKWLHTERNFPMQQTPFANCTEFKTDEVHTAYKKTLTAKWNNDKITPRWTNRNKPMWVF
jgi:hypothetical protein